MGNRKKVFLTGDKNHKVAALFVFAKYFSKLVSIQTEKEGTSADFNIHTSDGEFWSGQVKTWTKKTTSWKDGNKKVKVAEKEIEEDLKDDDTLQKSDRILIVVNAPIMIDDNFVKNDDFEKEVDGRKYTYVSVPFEKVEVLNWVDAQYRSIDEKIKKIITNMYEVLYQYIERMNTTPNEELIITKDMFIEAMSIIAINVSYKNLPNNGHDNDVQLIVEEMIEADYFTGNIPNEITNAINMVLSGKLDPSAIEFNLHDDDRVNNYFKDFAINTGDTIVRLKGVLNGNT